MTRGEGEGALQADRRGEESGAKEPENREKKMEV